MAPCARFDWVPFSLARCARGKSRGVNCLLAGSSPPARGALAAAFAAERVNGSSPHARGLTGRGPVEQSETQTQAGAGSDAPYAAAVKAERRRNQPRGARAVRRSVTTRSSRAEGQRLAVERNTPRAAKATALVRLPPFDESALLASLAVVDVDDSGRNTLRNLAPEALPVVLGASVHTVEAVPLSRQPTEQKLVLDDRIRRENKPQALDEPTVETVWVRLFFIEDFSPYSWALLPADASPQWPFREGHQAGQRVPASFRQPAEPRHGAEHLRSSPRQARSLLDIRAAFWYGAVGREADLRWL